MLDLEADLAEVFYGPDTAQPFTRVRSGAGPVEVMLILGVVDDEALDGRALTATRIARMPASADVRADDELVALAAPGASVPAGTRLRVLGRPERVVDGLEMEALLSSVPA